jgi:hypothetical protein
VAGVAVAPVAVVEGADAAIPGMESIVAAGVAALAADAAAGWPPALRAAFVAYGALWMRLA